MAEAAPPTRVAVIGCGAIAHEHLAYLGSSPLVELAAVCDLSRATARFAQERFRAGQSYTDAGRMLGEVRPEAVHILTPPQTHAPLVRLAIDAGAHVVCEKPMTETAARTEELLAYARRRGKLLIENRNLLFNDAVRAIDAFVVQGRLGSVREVDVLLSLDLAAGPFGDLNLEGPGVPLPGGAVHDFLPHLAYLFLHFAGRPETPVEVHGVLENRSGNRRVGFDHVDVLVRAEEARGRLRIASDLKPDCFRLAVRGTKGSVETDLYNPFLRLEGLPNVGKRAPLEQIGSGLKLARAGVRNLKDKVLQHGTYHGLPRMLEAVYQALRSGTAPPASEADMIAVARLVDRIVALGQVA
jgi:predicted dehydrogenase